MFASFALFIKNCHTVNDDHVVFNLSDLRPRGGEGTAIHCLYGYVPPNGVVILKLLI